VPAAAQTYPSRQIELVVPFVAGGTTDTVARLISQRLSDRWGQPVIVSNRPGGGSSIGTSQVAKAAPDGHTLMVTTIAFAINASLQKQPYDAVKDFCADHRDRFDPLMLGGAQLAAGHNIKEFIEYSKAQSGRSSTTRPPGPGTSTHLAAEMFKTMTGANPGARAVQGQRRGAQRAARRPRQGAFRADRFNFAARPQRRAPCACGDH
jgi:tripartite-type tricarboxylate transporter receptor subunit TctC